MRRRLLGAVCVLLSLGGANGCSSHETTAPQAPAANGGGAQALNAGVLDPTTEVVSLARSVILSDDITVSATIGPEGGSLSIPEAGGKIIIPAGALRHPTQIKMTARAGRNVVYEFCPHGTVFDVPVTIQQDLDYTVANGMKDLRTLQAGYFQQGLNAIFSDPGKSLARVTELRGVQIDAPAGRWIARFFIYHFSGYIMSSGFAPTDGGSDSTNTQL